MKESRKNVRVRSVPPSVMVFDRRSFQDGFGGGARKAIEKSRDEDGEDGVTIMAGRSDFSVARGRERSTGLGVGKMIIAGGKTAYQEEQG